MAKKRRKAKSKKARRGKRAAPARRKKVAKKAARKIRARTKKKVRMKKPDVVSAEPGEPAPSAQSQMSFGGLLGGDKPTDQ